MRAKLEKKEILIFVQKSAKSGKVYRKGKFRINF